MCLGFTSPTVRLHHGAHQPHHALQSNVSDVQFWHLGPILNLHFFWAIMTCSTDFSVDSSDSKPSSASSVEEPCPCSFGESYQPEYTPLPDDTDTEESFKDDLSRLSSENASQIITAQPARRFSRWMSSLRRRTMQRHILGLDSPPFLVDLYGRPQILHRGSSSGSSFGFVAGVKSATVSISSTAFARSARSVRTPLGRSSEESMGRGTPVDTFSIERALRRRRILEELIQTEEGYIRDVRLLMNVCFPFLFSGAILTFQVYITTFAACPDHDSLRLSIHQNLSEILGLHDEILGELHRAVPYSEYSYADTAPKGHGRWTSVDSAPPDMLAEPQIAAQVSRIFAQKVLHPYKTETRNILI